MPVKTSSAFETTYFDTTPATVFHGGFNVSTFLGRNLSDFEIRMLTGAPTGGTVAYGLVPAWSNTGADNPPAGLYFSISHPSFIDGQNIIGICLYGGTAGYGIYVKDVNFTDAAPAGMASVMIARMVRFCLLSGVGRIDLLAAGGRTWPDMSPGQRWGGYYTWARLGFDMDLHPDDPLLFPSFPHHPAGLLGCRTVQDVVKNDEGLLWWKVCGTGWFMRFDCSNWSSQSVATLDSYLAKKGL